MRYFPLLDFQTVILLVFLGLAVLILLFVGFGSYAFTARREEGEGEREEYAAGIQTTNKSIPPLLVFIYVAFSIWALVYVIVIGIRGGAF